MPGREVPLGQHLLVATRRSLHQVAEHVLAAARKTATGEIGLEPLPGGFGTPPLPDGRVLAVVGIELVVRDSDGERRSPLTTLRAAAELCGIEPGFPWTKHPPATPLEPDRELVVDLGAAGFLAQWFALAAQALQLFADDLRAAGEEPSPPTLFPEHFDLGITAAAVNYGASPGDDDIPVPYLYVGPHEGPPGPDDFWDAAFGAARTHEVVATATDAREFFREGRRRLVRP